MTSFHGQQKTPLALVTPSEEHVLIPILVGGLRICIICAKDCKNNSYKKKIHAREKRIIKTNGEDVDIIELIMTYFGLHYEEGTICGSCFEKLITVDKKYGALAAMASDTAEKHSKLIERRVYKRSRVKPAAPVEACNPIITPCVPQVQCKQSSVPQVQCKQSSVPPVQCKQSSVQEDVPPTLPTVENMTVSQQNSYLELISKGKHPLSRFATREEIVPHEMKFVKDNITIPGAAHDADMSNAGPSQRKLQRILPRLLPQSGVESEVGVSSWDPIVPLPRLISKDPQLESDIENVSEDKKKAEVDKPPNDALIDHMYTPFNPEILEAQDFVSGTKFKEIAQKINEALSESTPKAEKLPFASWSNIAIATIERDESKCANAVLACPSIRSAVFQALAKEYKAKATQELAKRSGAAVSPLMKRDVSDLKTFKWQPVVDEFAHYFPDLLQLMMEMCIKPHQLDNSCALREFMPKFGMIYAILARTMNSNLSAVQNIISYFLYDQHVDRRIHEVLQEVNVCQSFAKAIQRFKGAEDIWPHVVKHWLKECKTKKVWQDLQRPREFRGPTCFYCKARKINMKPTAYFQARDPATVKDKLQKVLSKSNTFKEVVKKIDGIQEPLTNASASSSNNHEGDQGDERLADSGTTEDHHYSMEVQVNKDVNSNEDVNIPIKIEPSELTDTAMPSGSNVVKAPSKDQQAQSETTDAVASITTNTIDQETSGNVGKKRRKKSKWKRTPLPPAPTSATISIEGQEYLIIKKKPRPKRKDATDENQSDEVVLGDPSEGDTCTTEEAKSNVESSRPSPSPNKTPRKRKRIRKPKKSPKITVSPRREQDAKPVVTHPESPEPIDLVRLEAINYPEPPKPKKKPKIMPTKAVELVTGETPLDEDVDFIILDGIKYRKVKKKAPTLPKKPPLDCLDPSLGAETVTIDGITYPASTIPLLKTPKTRAPKKRKVQTNGPTLPKSSHTSHLDPSLETVTIDGITFLASEIPLKTSKMTPKKRKAPTNAQARKPKQNRQAPTGTVDTTAPARKPGQPKPKQIRRPTAKYVGTTAPASASQSSSMQQFVHHTQHGQQLLTTPVAAPGGQVMYRIVQTAENTQVMERIEYGSSDAFAGEEVVGHHRSSEGNAAAADLNQDFMHFFP